MKDMDRMRELEIIEQGIKSDFWKIMKREIGDMQKEHLSECQIFLARGDEKKAMYSAGITEGIEKVLNAPEVMIKFNQSFLRRFASFICSLCGSFVKTLKKQGENGQKITI